MDYTTFKNQFNAVPLILSKTVLDRPQSLKERQQALNQFSRWEKRGLVVRLKKGIYVLNEHDRKINPSKIFIANQMYAPSYVSLEYALGLHGLIPERVVEVTSVTARKTQRISNPIGSFSYHHVKHAAFKGFRITKDENDLDVFLAEPEKAVVDFLYFRLVRELKQTALSPDIFEESYRFQNVDALKAKLLLDYSSLYHNFRLTEIVKLFCTFRKGHARR